MKKKNYVAIALFAVVVVMVAVGLIILLKTPTQTPTGNIVSKNAELATIKVGLLTPLTGPVAAYGENIQKGVEIARDNINSHGGINGHMIELIEEDSQCDGRIAVTAANKLVDVDGVIAIVGEACSASAIPVADVAEQKHFLVIPSAASNPELTKRTYAFRPYLNDLAQSQIIAKYVAKDMNVKKVGILSLNDEYGDGLTNEFKKRYSEYGGQVVQIEIFPSNANDFKTQITKMDFSKFDVLFIIAYPAQHPVIAKQLYELHITNKRVAEFNFGVAPKDAVNDAMNGTIYPTTVFDENATINSLVLEDQMKKLYNTDADILTAWGYDSLYVFSEAAKKCDIVTVECVRTNLLTLEYDGAAGHNKFTEDRELRDTPYVKMLAFG